MRRDKIAFQSTLPARGATDDAAIILSDTPISIHAPRTGSDTSRTGFCCSLTSISIHAPRTGSDVCASARTRYRANYFNPRSPHGERRTPRSRWPPPCNFNPRSPHGERPPAATSRRRTEISIHAPRTGSDLTAQLPGDGHKNFNPRSPHGERQLSCTNWGGKAIFQSTLPARGATRLRLCRKAPESHISIHAPRTGSDGCPWTRHFRQRISIHAPRTGSDGCRAGR